MRTPICIYYSYVVLKHYSIIYDNPVRVHSGRRRIAGAAQDNPAVSGPVAIMLNIRTMTTTTTTRKEKRTRPLSAGSPPQPPCTRYVGYVKKCLSRTSETGRPPLSCTHIHLQSLRVARIYL